MTQEEIMQTIDKAIEESGKSRNETCLEIMIEPKNLRDWIKGRVNPKLPTLISVLDQLGLKLEVVKKDGTKL